MWLVCVSGPTLASVRSAGQELTVRSACVCRGASTVTATSLSSASAETDGKECFATNVRSRNIGKRVKKITDLPGG